MSHTGQVALSEAFSFFPSPFSSHRGVPLRDRRWRQSQAVSKSVETEETWGRSGRQAVHTGNNESRNSWQTGLIWLLTAGVFTVFTCTMITLWFCNDAKWVIFFFPQLSNEFLCINSEMSSVYFICIHCIQEKIVSEKGSLHRQLIFFSIHIAASCFFFFYHFYKNCCRWS